MTFAVSTHVHAGRQPTFIDDLTVWTSTRRPG